MIITVLVSAPFFAVLYMGRETERVWLCAQGSDNALVHKIKRSVSPCRSLCD